MTTRFDNTTSWRASKYRSMKISDMETSHIINTLQMFAQQPARTAAMLIDDIEGYVAFAGATSWSPGYVAFAGATSWSPDPATYDNFKKRSLFAVTSLDDNELIEYALSSPLARAMCAELETRGVNVEAYKERVFGDYALSG